MVINGLKDMGSHLLLLNWDDHKTNVIGEFQKLFSHSELTDVTLVCEGFSLQAHKTVLSASSSFFHEIFLHHPCKHAFVVLTDVDSDELKNIVDFMYQGQVHIPQEKFTQFLTIAEKLKIKGLSAVTQNERCRSLELMMNIDCNSESLTHTDNSNKRQQNSSAALCEENEAQQAELSTVSRTVMSSTSHKSSCDNNPLLNINCGDKLSKCSTISFETQSDSLSDVTVSISRKKSELNFGKPVSNSTSYKNVKYEPCENASTVCRDEQLIHIDSSSEKQSHILYSDDLFQTNGTQQLEFRFNSSEVSLNSLSDHKSVKDEPYDTATSIYKDNSVFELESEFSQSSVPNVPSNSTSNLQIHCFPTQAQSIVKEAAHVFQRYPTKPLPDKISSSLTSIAQASNPVISTDIGSELNETRNSRCISKVVPNQLIHPQTLINSETESCDIIIAGSFSRCKICKKKFSNGSSLIAHQRSHIEEGHLCCGVCSKTFKWKQGLKSHMTTHSGEQPYSCSFCGRKFSRKGNMIIHKRIHTGEKPHNCNHCEKRFSDKTSLIYHLRRHHQEKLLSCYICKKSFINTCSLKFHIYGHFKRNELVSKHSTAL